MSKTEETDSFNSQIFNIPVDSDAINYLIHLTQIDKWLQGFWHIPLQNPEKEKGGLNSRDMKKKKGRFVQTPIIKTNQSIIEDVIKTP